MRDVVMHRNSASPIFSSEIRCFWHKEKLAFLVQEMPNISLHPKNPPQDSCFDRRIFMISALLLGILFIIGCGGTSGETNEQVTEPVVEQTQEAQEEVQDVVPEESEVRAPQSCTTDSDCDEGKCIDLVCGQLEGLYENTCEATCRIKGITVTTSDGQNLELVAGKGSYTAAGALQWKIESVPKHCEGQEARVPIEVTKYNYGQKISQEYITLAKGETSRVLDHPTISSVAFTLRVDDLTDECP